MQQVWDMVLLFISMVSAQTGERIIGGAECWPHSQPWQVFIYNGRISRCGGALVDRHWVLTAGHCLGSLLSIHLGEHDLQKQDHGEQNAKAVKVIRHPEFEPVSLKNDLMLLRMESPVTLGETIKVIPMAKECAPTGTKCVVSGWGTTSFPKASYAYVLHCMDTVIVSKDVCKAAYGSYFTENEICAGIMEGGSDTCQGDSGSPLVCNGILHGVVSWGAGKCGAKESPTVYTEICKHRKWIDETMAAK